MKNVRLLLITIAAVWFLGFMEAQAQNPPPAQDKSANIITRTIDVKNADVNRIIEILYAIAKATGTTMAPDQANKLIILTGNPDRIAEMESLIRRMDVPPSPSQDFSIELTAYLLVAGETASVGQPVPAQLEPALKQLRSTFTYKSYQLLDTLWMRNRVGKETKTSGYFPVTVLEARGVGTNYYSFTCMVSHVTHDGKGAVIHLDGLNIQITRSGGAQHGNISTNIDIRPGQMVVVGKTSFEGNQALIAVLTAKIVD
jgi:hypothetical protein